ncbi:hypothetical protein WJX74_000444 [Apatococcus lobatus]|uniref:Transmembrane protein n=1 Tax=Apatococcus lobatus TaxID=904363 RepID=A0AAW1Q8F2_9CHLO
MEPSESKGQSEPAPQTKVDFGGTERSPLHDPKAAESEEETSSVRKPRPRQVNGSSRNIHWVPLTVATLAAIALLWALFNGEELEKYHPQPARSMEKFLNHPVHLNEPAMSIVRDDKAARDNDMVEEEDSCSMLEFAEDLLPFECLGADRQKSKAFFDACNEIVAEQGWSFAQLQACGLMQEGY